jgi:hypothetical protein
MDERKMVAEAVQQCAARAVFSALRRADAADSGECGLNHILIKKTVSGRGGGLYREWELLYDTL